MSGPESSAVADAGAVVAGDWHEWLARRREEFETALSAHLATLKVTMGSHSRLPDAVLYSLNVGGKRLRPILVLESCRVCGGTSAAAMPAAIAIELVHTFSLIHDDLPAMDDDDLRRGQPANHKAFGEALAILAGDYLVTHAFTLLASESFDPQVAPKLINALGSATQWMIEGQAADIESEGRPPQQELVQYIHRHKTAALLEACCRLGALSAGASGDTISAVARYGRHLGLAFQIADDLLDDHGSESLVGKRLGKDGAASKQTYPAAFGVEESGVQARREVEAALQVLDAFGSRADRLRDLVRYVIQRDR